MTLRNLSSVSMNGVSFAWIVCVSCFALVPTASQAGDRVNVLYLLADDQCFDTIAALGNPDVITPNLDRLARQGVSFENAYNMGGWNGAVCIASRTMMHTGRYLWRSLTLESQLDQESQGRRLLPQLLADAGYETYMSGKWHVKIDANQIYDHVRHVRPGMPKDTPSSYGRPNASDDWQPWDTSLGGYWEGGKHWSEVLADDAIDYIDMAAKSEKPFFMYLAFNAPHDPRQSPREFVELYDRSKLSLPGNWLPEYPYREAMGAGKDLRDERLAPWPRTEEALRLHRQEYYALITHMDFQIGRILEALEASGLGENTLIVMTADHGLACGQHGLLGKQNMFEHSLKAPLLVSGPGIEANRRISAPVYIQDALATVLEFTGAGVPDFWDYRSFLPLLRDSSGEVEPPYEHMYGAYLADRQRMIREGNLKLIYYPKADVTLLFDLESDPLEMNNLLDAGGYAQEAERLREQLKKLMVEMDDPLLINDEE